MLCKGFSYLSLGYFYVFFYLFLFRKPYVFSRLFKYIAIFTSLGALLLVTSLYLRHRLETKYRDLSIIFLLLIILLLGIQYNQYEQNQVYANDTSRIVTFLNSVKTSQNLQFEDLRVNNQKITNGMILNIKDKYYQVNFNNDFTAYTLSEINLVNPNINIIDKENK